MKKLLLTSAILIATSSGIAYSATRPISADTDLPIKVQHQQEQLDNHEARITNVENDVKGLQSNTNTPPSTNKQAVPVVSPTTPDKPKVVIKAYEVVPEGENERCNLTYSDGSTFSFMSKQVDRSMGNAVIAESVCDDSLIGKVKNPDSPVGY